ncbi:polysaccharide deacetylase family protein [Clostridium tarantellae]|uniref:Polysaccharide deacetylase family protein n=1 Tax=Clostridium tarantellae TaxID=39493 RepID=A0A6I1MJF6_9CLOT|nr:polysaccharide deacetylase family protein [Clostridium tarantellae]MPQ43220.1 polysaccharide deacetylase family protein [Clostridium tarantellae]
MKKNIIFMCFIIIFTILITIPCFAYEKNEDKENYNEKKIVYLTFDDGPGGKVTEKILDTLKKEEVKATFFVIGELAKDQPNIINRIYNEGHAIGLHTYTHNKNKIYRNNKSFLEENIQCQKTIEEITGFKPYILRFPFGCNNSLYKLNKSMVDTLHENNFKIYDWNVDSKDGMNPKLASYKIANNSKSTNSNSVVLLHCGYVNKNSAEALPIIIKYYKDNNYDFKIIDNSTTEIYKIKKEKN